MHSSLLVSITFLFLCIIYYKFFTQSTVANSDNNLYFEMENVFLEKLKEGNKGCRIAFVYSLSELVIIKSLFQSEQIPFFCEFEHLSKIKTGLPISQVNNVIINVLEEDVNDSKFVLSKYKKTKEENLPYTTQIRNIFEFILISNSVPSTKFSTIRILR